MAVLIRGEEAGAESGQGPEPAGEARAGAAAEPAPADSPVAARAKRAPRASVVRACVDCRYWSNQSLVWVFPPKEAACRRHPPLPGCLGAQWPLTKLSDWCGDFEARKEAGRG
jgi:hypothetical protein